MTMSPMLIFHISVGFLVLICGTGALIFRKGTNKHAKSGTLFFVAMLMVTLSAMYFAIQKNEFPFIPILVCYLVVTSWMTVKRKNSAVGIPEIGTFIIISALAIGMLSAGIMPATAEERDESGLYLFFGSIAALAAMLDLNMIVRGGIKGAHRIARHLWRMCFAMTGAMASFFDQKRFIPDIIRETHLHQITLLLMLILMIYWLCKVLFTKWLTVKFKALE
ncbi:MAG: hypothetical protein OQK09_00265 [Colwellia sp.]|nr:hypothetical protein [Colwellia sp.]MCW9079920.1 hypothetical protein [Colwellia sp.]